MRPRKFLNFENLQCLKIGFKLINSTSSLTSNFKNFYNLPFFKFQYLDHYDLEIEQGTFCSWHHLALVSHSVIKANLKRYHLWDEAQILTKLDEKLPKFENFRFNISGINNFVAFWNLPLRLIRPCPFGSCSLKDFWSSLKPSRNLVLSHFSILTLIDLWLTSKKN